MIIIIFIILILSIWFTSRYDEPNLELENEKIEFSKYAINNLSGNLQREMGYAFDYYTLMLIDNPKGNFTLFSFSNRATSAIIKPPILLSKALPT